MLFSRIPKKHRKRQSAWLYSIVFNGAFSLCTVIILFLSFLVQPVHKTFAAESEAESASLVVADEVKEHSSESVIDPSAQRNTLPLIVEEDMSEGEDTAVIASEDELSAIPPPNEITDFTLPPDELIEREDGAIVTSDESLTIADEELSGLSEIEEGIASPRKDDVVHLEGLITEENYYQFSKQSCVAVGDGVYHCSTATGTPSDLASTVYADRGESGNMEIFLRTASGRVIQVTENVFDDTAPHFDAESMQIVWQRLIDGRYQIVLYDIIDERETQLTFSRTNNMEPKVSSAGIVWQAWDDNDWEVMFFDGSFTEQLTSNSAQDVAPVIQDRYVLWNVLGGMEQQAQVYSLDTKETLSIEGYEGGVISNPRFVLVYDTTFDNGDIITQSFDPATGLSEPIAATPAPAPIDIPDSDPIGEIRALISNKSKDEQAVVAVDVVGDGKAPSVDGDALDLKISGDAQSISTSTNILPKEPVFELTEYDLVIPPDPF